MDAWPQLRVLEVGDGLALGYAGRLLGDLGARVTRVPLPDDALPQISAADCAFRAWIHAGKTVQGAPAGGADAAADLLDACDLLLLAGAPAALQQAGWEPERIRARRPGLLVVAITPFGWSGPCRDDPADDLTLQALGGMSLGIGQRGRAPLALPGEQSAYQGGLCAAIVGAGLAFSGCGAFVDLALADVWATFYTGMDVANAHFGRNKSGRAGHRVSRVPYPRTIFPCKDGFFALQCAEGRHWREFLALVGREDLASDPMFANRIHANDRHGDAADALFEPWFRSRGKEEILALCLQRRIPGAPVYDLGEVVRHAHLSGRGYFRTADVDGVVRTLPTKPFRVAAESRAPDAGGSARAPGDVARPLAGIRIVDFGWVWAGAVPGHILADLGAEVIKVESMKRLDYMRQGRPIFGTERDPEQNPMFQNVNRAKLSLRIDMTQPAGARVVEALVARSHAVIENFSPGVLDKFGLGWERLSAVRPGLVMCAMSAVGQSGPLRDIRTYATMIAGLAGLDSLVGYPGERVLGSQSSYADPNASLHATIALLGALWRQRVDGTGAYLDLSQWEAAVNVLGREAVGVLCGEPVPGTRGVWHALKSPYGHYPVAGEDRWIALSVADDGQWRTLCDVLGAPAWAADARFATQAGRCEHRTALDVALAESTRPLDGDVLAANLRARGVPAQPVLDVKAVAAHPHFVARRVFQEVAHPVLKSVPIYGAPWQVDRRAVTVDRRAPLMGEHNGYVLGEVLGMSPAEIETLATAGVLD